MMEKKLRQSNIELLRIVCMLFVLALHANFKAFGRPNTVEISEHFVFSSLRYLAESLCIVAVDTFVLISGWFGIKTTMQGGLSFLFRCFFIGFICLFVSCIIKGPQEFSIDILFLRNIDSYWFVYSYLGLYIFSPVLNAFVNTASKRTVAFVLLAFFSFQLYTSWYRGFSLAFMHGYSSISFFGLYLLARFLRIHTNVLGNSKWIYLNVFLFSSLLTSVVSLRSALYQRDYVSEILFAYNSPFVILASVSLLLFFLKLKIQNSFINYVGSSSFAVYLFHCHACVFPEFISCCKNIDLYSFPVLFLFVFLISIAIDRLRYLTWSWISPLLK